MSIFSGQDNKIKARIAPCLDFGLVGQMSVSSPLRLEWCKSCRRGG